MRWPRRRTLPDVIAANMARPDPVPTPTVDLLVILLGAPDPQAAAFDRYLRS